MIKNKIDFYKHVSKIKYNRVMKDFERWPPLSYVKWSIACKVSQDEVKGHMSR